MVACSTASTCAFGRGSPEGSRTVPESTVLPACARAAGVTTAVRDTATSTPKRLVVLLIVLSSCSFNEIGADRSPNVSARPRHRHEAGNQRTAPLQPCAEKQQRFPAPDRWARGATRRSGSLALPLSSPASRL